MPHYHIWTIGCQMNKADSQCIAGYLEHIGYRPAPAVGEADIVVLNSCVVRQSAEDRVTNKLAALGSLGRGKLLVVTGCLVDSHSEALRRRFPRVDLFFAPQDYAALAGFLASRGAAPAPDAAFQSTAIAPTALVSIIRGCDNFCSYCIVPYRRGRERSRPLAEVVAEVAALASRGTKEVTLLGQNVDSYGHDLDGRPGLADLLREVNRIEGLARIRFLTSHPKDMDGRLIAAMARLDKVCPSLSLPLQAGDNDILRAMRRGYSAEQYVDLVADIRRSVPGIALSTDVIVGFPGEGEAQFRRTYDLLREIRFDVVHIACYSPRPGTIAARRLEDDVPPSQKVSRRRAVEELQEGIATAINAALLGQTVEVLVEGRRKGKWWGRTATDKLVFFEDEADRLGQLVAVGVERTSPWSLQGTVG